MNAAAQKSQSWRDKVKKRIATDEAELRRMSLTKFYEHTVYPIRDTQKCEDFEYVYLFYQENYGYKIGITTRHPKHRLYQIASHTPNKVFAIGYLALEAGFDEMAMIVENAIHKYFSDKKIKGEWFDLNEKDLLSLLLLSKLIGCPRWIGKAYLVRGEESSIDTDNSWWDRGLSDFMVFDQHN